MRRARVYSVVALALGIALAWFFLFGPSGTMCTATGAAVPGGPPVSTQECHNVSLVEVEGSLAALSPAPRLWFALWSRAPALAVIATFARERRVATTLIAIAIVCDLTGIISLGGGFLFALALVPLLVLALLAVRRAPRLG